MLRHDYQASLHSAINVHIHKRDSDVFNSLTTKFSACYKLAQSVVKIGSVLAGRVRQREVGGCTPMGDSTWRLLQMAVEKPWPDSQCRVGHVSAFLHKRA